ncbi:MAG: response regulator [Symploca sp. SIO1C4]|uniref:Response regulator n=1 Tax=Symploca sp. SIO1C4 TaxID=2607765 RepID=A0A6B3NC73_9CYAN|nr:response regulator [Symploca sp. SIO1C4]
MRILLVEDDELVVQALVKTLRNQNYIIDVAADGQAGLELLKSLIYDLIVLDVMLPKLDGITLCQQLRSQGLRTPVLLLTAQNSSTDKVTGLDAGADDYLTKPFDPQELSARIRALLRRNASALPPVLEWGSLRLDPSTCEVTHDSQVLRLTPKEYGLLELFLRNCHRVFSRSAILDHLWSFQETPGEETVTAHIKGLRRKLKSAGVTEDPIETVYGIGYRLKQTKPQQLKSHKKTSKRLSHPSPEVERQAVAKITGVWERVKEKFSKRVAVLEQATTAMLKDNLGDELRQQAEQSAHKLAGSLGMFDFDEGSRLAKEMESLFQASNSLNPEQMEQLSQLVVALRRELEQATAIERNQFLSAEEQPLVLIVQQELPLAQEWVREAHTRKMRGRIATSPTIARDQILQERPDVVLLDLSSAVNVEAGLSLISELNTFTPPVPILVLTAEDSSIDRAKIARLGGRGFLKKPVSSQQVWGSLTQALQKSQTAQARVMVVDDDPQILMALRNLLNPWGMKLHTLDNPLKFWETIEAASPDLLILDVEMPYHSGIELCQAVRNNRFWAGLPVLFLTAHTDVETMKQVFAVGADDFVSKPIVGPELVTRILNRLERSRLLRNLTRTDALTGVANYRYSSQELNQLLAKAQYQSQPLCFALLKLDCLKQINLQYGHALGEQVLSRFGELLRQSFHSEDVIARWGGSEFVVGMYGMNHSEGKQRLSELLNILRQEQFRTPNHRQVQVVFSAGIVEYPRDGEDLQTLYQAADAWALQAKASGGDHVLSIELQSSSLQTSVSSQ